MIGVMEMISRQNKAPPYGDVDWNYLKDFNFNTPYFSIKSKISD